VRLGRVTRQREIETRRRTRGEGRADTRDNQKCGEEDQSLKLTGPGTLNDDMEVLIRHACKLFRDSLLRLQLPNAFDATLQLQSFERILKACAHIDVHLPDAALSVTPRRGNMMTDLP